MRKISVHRKQKKIYCKYTDAYLFREQIGTIGGRGGARTAVGAYIEHTLGVIV